MTHREFYAALSSRVRNHLLTLRDLQSVCDSERAKSEDNLTYGEAVRRAAAEKANTARYVLERELEAAKTDVEQFIRGYAAELRSRDALNPADLTDDARLLTGGLPLTERDYRAILERSQGNATMLQLTLRAAKTAGVDLGGEFYIGHAQAAQSVENTLYTVHTVLERHMRPDSEYYDRLIGEGSQLHQVFGIE